MQISQDYLARFGGIESETDNTVFVSGHSPNIAIDESPGVVQALHFIGKPSVDELGATIKTRCRH